MGSGCWKLWLRHHRHHRRGSIPACLGLRGIQEYSMKINAEWRIQAVPALTSSQRTLASSANLTLHRDKSQHQHRTHFPGLSTRMASMFWRLPVGRAGRTTAIRAISTLGVAPMLLRRQTLKCDERPRTTMDAPFTRRHLPVSPRTINQFATCSLAGKQSGTPQFFISRDISRSNAHGLLLGLCAGVVLRLFSPVLTLISGLVGLALLVSAADGFSSGAWLTLGIRNPQVASKYGFTARPVFRGIMRTSRIGHWSEAGEKFVFKLTFATTLVLAAFVRF